MPDQPEIIRSSVQLFSLYRGAGFGRHEFVVLESFNKHTAPPTPNVTHDEQSGRNSDPATSRDGEIYRQVGIRHDGTEHDRDRCDSCGPLAIESDRAKCHNNQVFFKF
jgi:hypothetical protein